MAVSRSMAAMNCRVVLVRIRRPNNSMMSQKSQLKGPPRLNWSARLTSSAMPIRSYRGGGVRVMSGLVPSWQERRGHPLWGRGLPQHRHAAVPAPLDDGGHERPLDLMAEMNTRSAWRRSSCVGSRISTPINLTAWREGSIAITVKCPATEWPLFARIISGRDGNSKKYWNRPWDRSAGCSWSSIQLIGHTDAVGTIGVCGDLAPRAAVGGAHG